MLPDSTVPVPERPQHSTSSKTPAIISKDNSNNANFFFGIVAVIYTIFCYHAQVTLIPTTKSFQHKLQNSCPSMFSRKQFAKSTDIVKTMCNNMLMDALISEHRDVACSCNFELGSFSQTSADEFVKLSNVMGLSKGVQMHLARWVNCRNECRRWWCAKYSLHYICNRY